MTAHPLLLYPTSADDPLFRYASGFGVEQGLYVRLGDREDVLVVSGLELERARAESAAAEILDRVDVGWRERRDVLGAWADVAAGLLRRRGVSAVRVAPTLPAAVYEELRRSGVGMEIDADLFVEERRRKTDEQLEGIRAAQRAAEAACREVVRGLAEATPRDGVLMRGGEPLTSEWLMARAQLVLGEHGCGTDEMIVCGAPDSALPHARGTGPIRAGGPVVIDIFPRHRASGYHGDLTRTVVVGDVPPRVRDMHRACLAALDEALRSLRAGADGRDVHRAACRVLVDAGYGTLTEGLEGEGDVPRMVHSTGHGIGLEVHEAPQLRDLSWPLAARDVVTVEPGLYLLGVGGVRVEDTVAVTDEGHDNLTTLTRDLEPDAYL
jgi:Xaa-Pro aminopeptidase